MEQELREYIDKEIQLKDNQEFLQRICKEYLDYYFEKSSDLKTNLKKLIKKYNDKTILSFLKENSYPEQYTHLSLGHDMGDKNLIPMLDNDGAIYPPDFEIGQIIEGANFWNSEESDRECELRWQFHDLIFYSWLSINWLQIEGYKAGIVVKTTENNSIRSWFLNDFQFDSNSKFDLEHNWKDAISKFNLTKISMKDLIENVKKGIR